MKKFEIRLLDPDTKLNSIVSYEIKAKNLKHAAIYASENICTWASPKELKRYIKEIDKGYKVKK